MKVKLLGLLALVVIACSGCDNAPVKTNPTPFEQSIKPEVKVETQKPDAGKVNNVTVVKPDKVKDQVNNDKPENTPKNPFSKPTKPTDYFNDGQEEGAAASVSSDDQPEKDSSSEEIDDGTESLKRDLEMIRLKVKKIQYIYKKSMEDKVKENERLKKEIDKLKLKIERMNEVYKEKVGESFEGQ